MADPKLLHQYRLLNEKIGRAYADLEALEGQRTEMERALFPGNGAQLALSPPGGIQAGPTRLVDKKAHERTAEFLRGHFIAHKEISADQMAVMMGCTPGAAMGRLRHAAQQGLGNYRVGPIRLERIEAEIV